jgi:hypothetical protein
MYVCMNAQIEFLAVVTPCRLADGQCLHFRARVFTIRNQFGFICRRLLRSMVTQAHKARLCTERHSFAMQFTVKAEEICNSETLLRRQYELYFTS